MSSIYNVTNDEHQPEFFEYKKAALVRYGHFSKLLSSTDTVS